MLFNLDFPNNTILSFYQYCFNNYYFITTILLYFLIPAVIAQIFNPIAELVIPIGILTRERKSEIETHTVISDIKIRKCSIYKPCTKLFVLFTDQFISIYFFN